MSPHHYKLRVAAWGVPTFLLGEFVGPFVALGLLVLILLAMATRP